MYRIVHLLGIWIRLNILHRRQCETADFTNISPRFALFRAARFYVIFFLFCILRRPCSEYLTQSRHSQSKFFQKAYHHVYNQGQVLKLTSLQTSTQTMCSPQSHLDSSKFLISRPRLKYSFSILINSVLMILVNFYIH